MGALQAAIDVIKGFMIASRHVEDTPGYNTTLHAPSLLSNIPSELFYLMLVGTLKFSVAILAVNHNTPRSSRL